MLLPRHLQVKLSPLLSFFPPVDEHSFDLCTFHWFLLVHLFCDQCHDFVIICGQLNWVGCLPAFIPFRICAMLRCWYCHSEPSFPIESIIIFFHFRCRCCGRWRLAFDQKYVRAVLPSTALHLSPLTHTHTHNIASLTMTDCCSCWYKWSVCLVLRLSFTCCISLLLFGFASTLHERGFEGNRRSSLLALQSDLLNLFSSLV